MSEKKGYALLIGIDEFPLWHGLGSITATKDVDYWSELLRDYYYYETIMELRNADATFKNVILSLYYLAGIAQSGDIVVISFSTHGLFSSFSGNSLVLYNNREYLKDEVLYFMLRLFRKDVRINIILDICQSEGFVSSNPLPLNEAAEQQIENAFADEWIWLKWLRDAIVAMTEVHIVASIAVLATASRHLLAPDGYIIRFARDVFDDSFLAIDWWEYTFETFRSKLEQKLDEDYSTFNKERIQWIEEIVKIDNPRVDAYLKRLPKALNKYETLDPRMATILSDLSNLETGHNKLIIENWANYFGLSNEGCPHLNWRGIHSPTFKTQWVFEI